MNGKINNVFITQGCNIPNKEPFNNISFKSKEIKDSFESTTNAKLNAKNSPKQTFFNKFAVSFKGVKSVVESAPHTTLELIDPIVDFEAFRKDITSYEHLSEEDISIILKNLTPEKTKFARMLCQDKVVPDRQIGFILLVMI